MKKDFRNGGKSDVLVYLQALLMGGNLDGTIIIRRKSYSVSPLEVFPENVAYLLFVIRRRRVTKPDFSEINLGLSCLISIKFGQNMGLKIIAEQQKKTARQNKLIRQNKLKLPQSYFLEFN